MARTVITDSGFWIGLLDKHDQHAHASVAWHGKMQNARLLVPWPCVYEVVSARMSRHPGRPHRFIREVRSGAVTLIDDTPYRDSALGECGRSTRDLSLTDLVIRRIICDPKARKHDLLTFNPKDFKDVCFKHRVSILSGHPSSFHN